MRHFSSAAAAVIALGALIPFGASGQAGLSITNYQLVSETKISRSVSDFAYRADVVNTSGTARPSLTATVTSSVASTEVIQGSLHFTNVPANGQVTSTDTFTIRVDRSVAFDFANLHWTFAPPQNPVANAGPGQTVTVGATVTLNGSGSTNPSGVGTLTYSWAFASRPAGSTATLTNPTSVTPTFVPDVAGPYIITLTVSNGVGSDSASVTITANPGANTPPVANAGPNQTVAVGATVTLTGSGSTDADGDPLTFSWTFVSKPAGSTATLTGANTVSPTFVADKSTINSSNYTVQLIVNDGKVNSAPATVVISTSNSAPVANAGPNQTVNVGAQVQLTGAASTDVDSDPLTYQWSLITRPANSTATLSSATIVNPTFTADQPGTYVAQLIVNDGKVNSAPATVTISTSAVPPPTANAGPNQTVVHGATVTLNGTASSDPQSRPLTFQWSLTTKPAGSNAVLANPTTANPTFVADVPGNYVAQLIVNNGFASSAPATVTITTTNTPPNANAGPSQNVQVGATVTLNGSGSSDPDNDPITYSWSFNSKPAGSTATLTGATTVSPTFVADVAGPYVIQLIVSDPFSSSTPVTVTVTATPNPTASFSPGSITIIGTATQNLTLTLSQAAGAGGVTLNLSSSNTGAATVPATATITQGNTSVTVPVTGVAPGAAVIHASNGTIADTTANVTVVAQLAITTSSLPNGKIGAAYSQTLAATGGTGARTWAITSGTLPAGLSLNASTGQITGTPTGAPSSTPLTFQVTDSGTPPQTATANLTLAITVGDPATLTVTSGSPQSTQVNSAFAAPLVVTVKDAGGNPVPNASVTFTAPGSGPSGTFTGGTTTNTVAANASGVATSATFAANGSAGSYNVTASSGTATPATFSLTNTPVTTCTAGNIGISSGSVGQNLEAQLTLTLPNAAPPGGTNVTLTSSNANLLALSGRPGDAGVGTLVVPVPEGSTTVGFFAQGMASSGTATISASGAGGAGCTTINLTPSAFVIDAGNGPGNSISTPQNSTRTLIVSAYRLDSNLAPQEPQQVRGNFSATVPLTSSSTSVGTVSPASVTINGGDTSANATFTALATGATTVTAGTPAGFSTPASGNAVNISVTPQGLTACQVNGSNVTVGQNLETNCNITSNSPAGSDTVITLVSNDPSKLLFSLTPEAAGSSSIQITLQTGRTGTQDFFVQGLVSSGSATFSASSSIGSATGTVNFGPSGFAINTPFGIGADFITTTGADNTDLTIFSALLDSSLNFVTPQAVRGGLTVNVPVTSSNTTVGTITTSPVTFPGGTAFGFTQFDPATEGTSKITAATPTGFSTPAVGASVNVTVIKPHANVTDGISVGKNLQTIGTLLLGQAAPAGGLQVTLTSHSANLLLSLSPTTAGSSSIVINVPAGANSATYYIQALTDSGSGTYTATASGYQDGNGTVFFAPSGVVIQGPFGFGFPLVTTVANGPQPVTVSTAILDSSNNFSDFQELAGGQTLSVTLANSNPAVGTVPSPVTIAAGTNGTTVQFTPLSVGQTTISVIKPANFSQPTANTTLTARVNP